MILDTKLTFKEYLENILSKVNRTIEIFYKRCETICLEHYYLQYLHPLSDLILIAAMLNMTRIILLLQ